MSTTNTKKRTEAAYNQTEYAHTAGDGKPKAAFGCAPVNNCTVASNKNKATNSCKFSPLNPAATVDPAPRR